MGVEEDIGVDEIFSATETVPARAAGSPAALEPFERCGRVERHVFADGFLELAGQKGAQRRASMGGGNLRSPNRLGRKLERNILPDHA